MTPALSPNTKAILLLTAPMIAGSGSVSTDLLSQKEYKRLARHLREIQHQPSDLLWPNADELLRDCRSVIDEDRLQRLLGRGFLLSQAIERWQARAIWVVSRADVEYPRRLKRRLGQDTPAVIYGCGDVSLLDQGGLAVVGSRNVDSHLIEYTREIGRLAAKAGRTIISGGAKGVDQAAMRGALEVEGKVIGVLADSLEKNAMNRDNRNFFLQHHLTLISPYDPSAGFNVGHAMQRNKLIYALADASLVVSSDYNKGGTWNGAIEQLDKFKFVPVFIRSTGEPSDGLSGLRQKGALPWPNPSALDTFEDVINSAVRSYATAKEVENSLFASDERTEARDTPFKQLVALDSIETLTYTGETEGQVPGDGGGRQQEFDPAEYLYTSASTAIQRILAEPMKDAVVASLLNVSIAQAKVWLQRMVTEGVIEKQKKPVGYVVKQQKLFE